MPTSEHRDSLWLRIGLAFTAEVSLLKGLTWRRLGYTVLVAEGLLIWTLVGRNISGESVAESVAWIISYSVPYMLIVQMLAMTVADNVPVTGIRRTGVLLLGFAIGTYAAIVLNNILNPLPGWPPWQLPGRSNWLGVMNEVWLPGLIAIAYFQRRRDAALGAALHKAEATRVELQKKTLESGLQVMQARVEPRFLLNTLRRIGDLYDTDCGTADRMLDNLIAYLRAALPQMRSSTSTLGQEIDLTRAYLGIEQIRAGGRLEFAFDVPDDLAAATFPPMVLLPLIEVFALGGLAAAAERVELGVEVRLPPEKLVLTLTRTGAGDASPADIENLRGRLAALYGGEARLVISPQAHGAVAILEVPHVPS